MEVFMKNSLKLFGIVILLMVIGLTFTACGKNNFIGTWIGNFDRTTITLVMSETTWTMAEANNWGSESISGSYTYSGDSATLVSSTDDLNFTATLSTDGNSLIITGTGDTVIFNKLYSLYK
jgi:uncharacterized lipoprotein YehR (DUF1307 family)